MTRSVMVALAMSGDHILNKGRIDDRMTYGRDRISPGFPS
jgi:hypothetical protein